MSVAPCATSPPGGPGNQGPKHNSVEVVAVKVVWLLSVPVIALVALFAVRSSPTLAGPASPVVDQAMENA